MLRYFVWIILICLASLMAYNSLTYSILPNESDHIHVSRPVEEPIDPRYINYNRKEVCECRKSSSVKLLMSNGSRISVVKDDDPKKSYEITLQRLNRTTCDLYNTLRRPIDQKIYSVSLYGKSNRYYQLMKCKCVRCMFMVEIEIKVILNWFVIILKIWLSG